MKKAFKVTNYNYECKPAAKTTEMETYKWYFKFSKPVNCYGFDIYEDQCFAEDLETARHIIKSAYSSLNQCNASHIQFVKKEKVTLFQEVIKPQFEDINNKILDLEESILLEEFEDQD